MLEWRTTMSEGTVARRHSGYRVASSVKNMAKGSVAARPGRSPLSAYHRSICLQTEARLQFVDFTEQLAEVVRSSGVRTGFANIQTRHTTTAVMVNEKEPL